jgi:hypothetical protein
MPPTRSLESYATNSPTMSGLPSRLLNSEQMASTNRPGVQEFSIVASIACTRTIFVIVAAGKVVA